MDGDRSEDFQSGDSAGNDDHDGIEDSLLDVGRYSASGREKRERMVMVMVPMVDKVVIR